MKRYFKLLFEKNHWSLYEKILKLALKNNYNVLSLKEYYNNIEKYKDKKVLLLRHDVDHSPHDALVMFNIEKKYNIKSTYYFRWVTSQEEIIKEIKDAGFEVGLHYETLSSYIKANNLKDINTEHILICKNILEKEIEEFTLLFGGLNSICSHGAIENRLFKVPNTILVDKTIREKYGIFEAYDLKEKFDVYISDNDFTINPWKYNTDPITEIKKRTEKIYFLSHPVHWGRNIIKRYYMKKYRETYNQYNI
ncbi:polysaccharide deacetylase family protein [Marinitoga aeolica]|uniref:Polysaccharide deacetylase n=1 Tax=Marinitoga aeolica TaxID=2809031 RepID=A0ABY8PTT3_9BACT|nr:hypothetical protein [Marinitoga aeolica]WGS66037.1 hypothetical protein JRV97_05675 [Marinitoga aeolica]